jgi:hypothetical protein
MKKLLTILFALCLAMTAKSQPALPGAVPPMLLPIATPYSGAWTLATTDAISGLAFLGGINATNATNIFNSLVVGQTNAYMPTLNGIATNVSFYSNVFFGPFPTLLVDTNSVGIHAAGVASARGEYLQTAIGTWTNAAGNGSAIVFMNPTYFLQTNNVSLYSTPSLLGNSVWVNVIGSSAVPTNSGFGYRFSFAGLNPTNFNVGGVVGILPMISLDTTKVLTNNEQAITLIDPFDANTNNFGGKLTILGTALESSMSSAGGLGADAFGLNSIANGAYSFAAGVGAVATNNYSMVFSDNSGGSFANFGSTTNNMMSMNFQNGYRFNGGAMIGNGAGLTNLQISANLLGNGFGLTNLNPSSITRGTATFQPSTTIVQTIPLVVTNDVFLFGTSTAAGTGVMHYNPSISWNDDNSVTHTGAWTNSTQTMALDIGLGPAFVIDATPLDASAFTYSFSINANFDYNLNEFTIPQGLGWDINTGAGTFFATNNLTSALFTNSYTIGLTNNYDFWAAVKSLPFATNQTGFRGGGTVYVPPGLTFIGTNSALYHQGFALDIEGSLGGMSVLVITNGNGTTPGMLFGSVLQSTNDFSTYPAITIRNLVVCNQGDFTNAVLSIVQAATLYLENVTVAPFSSYLGASQFGSGGGDCTNSIGIKISIGNGQQETLNNITVDAEHIGLDIRADHPTVVGLNLFRNGNSTGTNSWPTNSVFSIRGAGIVLEGAIHEQYSGMQNFENYVDILNNEPVENSPALFVGGDWGEVEGSAARSATTFPNANAIRFIQNNAFTPGTVSDKMLNFNGTGYTVSTTNNPGIESDFITGNGTNTAFVISLGGSPALTITNRSITANGAGLSNIPSGAIQQLPRIPTAVTLTGSVFTFSNATPNYLECYFSGSVAYSVSKNGAAVFGSLASDGYLILQPTNKIAITYTVAPTLFTNAF